MPESIHSLLEALGALGWIQKSIIAAIMFPLIFPLVQILKQTLGVKTEVTFTWYFTGVWITYVWYLYRFSNVHPQDFLPSLPLGALLVGILLWGILIGIPNVLFIQAVGEAPNSGLVLSITNTSSIVAYLFTWCLALLLPQFNKNMKFDLVQLLLIFIAVTAMSLALSRTKL